MRGTHHIYSIYDFFFLKIHSQRQTTAGITILERFMENTEYEFTFMTDLLFKKLFVNYPDLLKKLVCDLLELKPNEINEFNILNSEMPVEFVDTKHCRLDINMKVNDQIVELAIQVDKENSYPERVLFNWAKNYVSVPSGTKYSHLPRVVVININKKSVLNCKEYHSEFVPLEVTRYDVLCDRMSLHFFELEKIPLENHEEDMILLWLKLFKAKSAEDFEKIKKLGVPEMDKAISAYYDLTADQRFRQLARMRELTAMNEAQALYDAEQRGLQQGLEKGLQQGLQQGIQQGLQQGEQLGEERADAKWQEVAVENEQLRAEIASLKAQLGNAK